MRRIILFCISIYQKTISPDHGWFKNRYPFGYCKYYPSCSEYTRIAVQKHGLYGLVMGFKRILKCNPFSHGGIDLPH